MSSGQSDAVFGGEPTRFNNVYHIDVEVPDSSASRGDSKTDIATAGDSPVALPPDVAEYSPEILAEFSSDMQFSYTDTEVYGIHMPVRHGSMRVPTSASLIGTCYSQLGRLMSKINILYAVQIEEKKRSKDLERLVTNESVTVL